MGVSDKKGRRDRLSTRNKIETVLDHAGIEFQDSLSLAASTGKVEDVRQACLNLALLKAFQTSLGQGSAAITAAAANILGVLLVGFTEIALTG
jgi:separase